MTEGGNEGAGARVEPLGSHYQVGGLAGRWSPPRGATQRGACAHEGQESSWEGGVQRGVAMRTGTSGVLGCGCDKVEFGHLRPGGVRAYCRGTVPVQQVCCKFLDLCGQGRGASGVREESAAGGWGVEAGSLCRRGELMDWLSNKGASAHCLNGRVHVRPTAGTLALLGRANRGQAHPFPLQGSAAQLKAWLRASFASNC